YGLFSINAWKQKLTAIVFAEINNLDLSAANEKKLKQHIEVQLDVLINKIDNKVRESNKGTAKGWLKQSLINAFVDIGDIKAGIPGYADAIMAEMTKAKTEHQVKTVMKKQVAKYLDKTFEEQDLTQVNVIMAKTDSPDIDTAKEKLNDTVDNNRDLINLQSMILIAMAISLFVFAGFVKGPLPPGLYISLVVMLIILLVGGVSSPMIDMEAKISEMSFVLMDHPVKFENQILYFQSKSILDVFWIMFTHDEIKMKIVGILMVLFSIVFPLFKMVSSLVYYYDFKGSRANKWIQFFVLKSGKWSMTDVLIVAIFMAYIGFNGIISSQFGSLSSAEKDVVILTTNGTQLQPGFYIFLTYTVLALFLTGLLTRKPVAA
ncbi:MAG: paraquat-inducible protein A, partial [Bdellovibrionota bacterium]